MDIEIHKLFHFIWENEAHNLVIIFVVQTASWKIQKLIKDEMWNFVWMKRRLFLFLYGCLYVSGSPIHESILLKAILWKQKHKIHCKKNCRLLLFICFLHHNNPSSKLVQERHSHCMELLGVPWGDWSQTLPLLGATSLEMKDGSGMKWEPHIFSSERLLHKLLNAPLARWFGFYGGGLGACVTA